MFPPSNRGLNGATSCVKAEKLIKNKKHVVDRPLVKEIFENPTNLRCSKNVKILVIKLIWDQDVSYKRFFQEKVEIANIQLQILIILLSLKI